MKKIYIIEDDAIVRKLLIAHMAEFIPGHEVVGSSDDGMVAMQECLKLQPDMIIVDIRLPEVNGLEILHILKNKIPHLKVLIYSGIADKKTIEIAVHGDTDGYVLKTSGFQELVKAVKSIVAGGSYFSPDIYKLGLTNNPNSTSYNYG